MVGFFHDDASTGATMNVSVTMRKISYAKLRRNLSLELYRVVKDQDVVIICRPHTEDVALLPANDLSGLIETLHLLRSPKNASRLLTALRLISG